MWREDPTHAQHLIIGGTSVDFREPIIDWSTGNLALDAHYVLDQGFLKGDYAWDETGKLVRSDQLKVLEDAKKLRAQQSIDANGKVTGYAFSPLPGVTLYTDAKGEIVTSMVQGADGRQTWRDVYGRIFEIDFHTDIINLPERTSHSFGAGDSPTNFGLSPDLRLAYGTDTKTGISIEGEQKKIPVDGVPGGPRSRTDADTSLWGPSKSDAVPQAQEWEQQNAQDYLNEGKSPTLHLPDGRTPNASEIVPGPPPPNAILVAPPPPATAPTPQGQSPQRQSPQGSLGAGGQSSDSAPRTWRSVLGDVYRGIAQEGIRETILGPLEAMAATNPLVGGAAMGYGAYQGYRARGVEGALNSVNPLFELFKSAVEGYNAVEERDYVGLGRASVRVGKSMAGLAGAAIAGAAVGPGLGPEAAGESAAEAEAAEQLGTIAETGAEEAGAGEGAGGARPPAGGGDGPSVPEMKNKLFLSREPGLTPAQRAQEALSRYRAGTLEIPEGLTRQDLLRYRDAALDAILRAEQRSPESGARARAVQGPRIQLIDEILGNGGP